MTGNNIQLIDDCRTELSNISNFISLNPFDTMVRYLVSYAVIKCCGTIEIVYKDIIYNHLTKNANAEAISYFSKNIKESSSNPSTNKISNLLIQLNTDWKNNFESQIDSIDKGYLNSLVNLRNDLSHGRSITSTIDNVINYFDGGCKILNVLDSIVR